MARIEFIDAPGRRYDLFFLFVLYFNKEHCLANFTNPEKAREDTEFMERLWEAVAPVPEELLPFFRLNDDGKSLITGSLFKSGPEVLEEFRPEDTFAGVDTMTRAATDFWLNCPQDAPTTTDGMKKINAAIRASGCDHRLRSALYSLLIDPQKVLDTLIGELNAKARLDPAYYTLKTPEELKSSFEPEPFNRDMSLSGWPFDLSRREKIYVSFCVYAKNCIRASDIGGGAALLLLGQDYADQLASLRGRTEVPRLDVFGTAIAEKNRIDILNLILTRGEVSIKDVEQELKFSGTNAYYHLSLMIKANMLKTRSRGKAVYYSINRRFFDSVIRVLGKYGELSAYSQRGCDAGGPEWVRRMGGE